VAHWKVMQLLPKVSMWHMPIISQTRLTSTLCIVTNTHTHTHPFNGPLSRTTQVSRYQKGTTNLDFTEARDSEWQWHQLGHMQVCTSLQRDNHASTPPLEVFLQAGCSSCHPTNSVKALKAIPYVLSIHTFKYSDTGCTNIILGINSTGTITADILQPHV